MTQNFNSPSASLTVVFQVCVCEHRHALEALKKEKSSRGEGSLGAENRKLKVHSELAWPLWFRNLILQQWHCRALHFACLPLENRCRMELVFKFKTQNYILAICTKFHFRAWVSKGMIVLPANKQRMPNRWIKSKALLPFTNYSHVEQVHMSANKLPSCQGSDCSKANN